MDGGQQQGTVKNSGKQSGEQRKLADNGPG